MDNYQGQSRIYTRGGIWEQHDGLVWANEARRLAALIATDTIVPQRGQYTRWYDAVADTGEWVACGWVKASVSFSLEVFHAVPCGGKYIVSYDLASGRFFAYEVGGGRVEGDLREAILRVAQLVPLPAAAWPCSPA